MWTRLPGMPTGSALGSLARLGGWARASSPSAVVRSLGRAGPLLFACASLAWAGCASSPTRARSADYFRSPTRDYVEPLRSASDGEVVGADKQSVDDRILVNPTNAHLALGWGNRDGRLSFHPTRVRGGYGVFVQEPACGVPLHGPPLPGERQALAALRRAWQESQRGQMQLAALSATAEVAGNEPDFLSCQW